MCFAIFGKNSKIQNGRHFWGGENFLKIGKSRILRYPVGRKFCRNRSISHGYGDRSKLVFCHFGQKFENSKWPPFLGRGKFFKNYQEYNAQIPCGSKILTKSLYLARLRRFGKNSKIQNGRHFWGGENFLKIAKITFLRYPVGRKFRRNHSISHS